MSRGIWVGGEAIGKIEVSDENAETIFTVLQTSNVVGSILGSHLTNILDYQIVFSLMYGAAMVKYIWV